MSISSGFDRQLPVISITRHGHTICIEPKVPELVELFYVEQSALHSNEGQFAMLDEKVSLVVDGRTSLRLPAGMTRLVREALRKLRYRIRELGRTEDTQLRRLARPRANPGGDRSFLDAIYDQEQGLIGINANSVNLPRLILQAAFALPRARIVCAATTVSEVQQLFRPLRGHLLRQVSAIESDTWRSTSSRVVVGTYACLGGGEADLHGADFVFALNAAEMLQNEYGRLTIRNANRSRLFGFLRTDSQLTPSEKALIQAIFGERRLVIPTHSQIERPIHAVFLPFIDKQSSSSTDSVAANLSTGIWRHPIRNRRIARLAIAIATRDDKSIARIVNNPAAAKMICRRSDEVRVGVLVENLEQALSLLRGCPHWQLIAGSTLDTAGLACSDTELIRRAIQNEAASDTGAIITSAGLQQAGQLDIVLRADAGVGAFPTHWAHASCTSDRAKLPAVVVDFADRHHAVFRQRSRKRERAYLDRGWRLPIQYPTLLDQYLAARTM